MKLTFAIVSTLALLATPVIGQSSYIGYPAPGATVHRGKHFVVQVIRPNSIQGSQEVGLAIGLLSCPGPNPCPPPSAELGAVLFAGRYNPVRHELTQQPYQNFTVKVPDADYFNGAAQLSVSRFHLIGAGPSPILEFHNLTLNVV